MLPRANLLQRPVDPLVHALHGAGLPPQDLLAGRRGGVALRIHRYRHVHVEAFPRQDFADDLLRQLDGDGVMTEGVRVPQPGKGRAEKVLVLDVDEGAGVADKVDVLALDGVVHVGAVLAVQAEQPVLRHDGRVGGDGAEYLGHPRAALLGGDGARAVPVELVLGERVEALTLPVVLLAPPV